ncbi:unnamed protein product, partial [Citrullus colocynthis]
MRNGGDCRASPPYDRRRAEGHHCGSLLSVVVVPENSVFWFIGILRSNVSCPGTLKVVK